MDKCLFLNQMKQLKSMAYQHKPLEDGKQKESLSLSGPRESIEDFQKQVFLEKKQEKRKLSTVESVQQNKKTILKGKKKQCLMNTRDTKLLPMLVQDLTLKEKDSYGWWTKFCEETSKKLLFPIEIGCVDSLLNFSNGFVTEVQQDSLLKIKKYIPKNKSYQRISWPSSMFSHVDTTGCDVINGKTKKNMGRSKREVGVKMKAVKTRMYPTTAQAKVLRDWMKAMRYTYNQGLTLVKNGKAKADLELKKVIVTSKLRPCKKIKDDEEVTENKRKRIDDFEDNLKEIKILRKYIKRSSKKWKDVVKTPPNIRTGAVLDLIDSFKTASKGFQARIQRIKIQKGRWNKRKKNVKKKEKEKRRRWKKRKGFEIKFKSKRLTKDSMRFESQNVSLREDGICLFEKDFKDLGTFKTAQPITEVTSCPRISYVFGRWYFIYSKEFVKEESNRTNRIIALDPGVRTFQSYFTSDNEQGEIGKDLSSLADKIHKKIDGIREKIDQLKTQHCLSLDSKKKRLKSLNKSWYRTNARARHLVDDFHWKTIKFMLKNFDTIIAPKLNVSQLVKKDEDVILQAITRRRMLFQRHSDFNIRLRFKASTYTGKNILDLEEHGTSVTCSSCGFKNLTLGSSKIFNCPYCDLKCDRDLNSAKNHLLKAAFGNTNY
jgi:transposase